jgi:hypothetical protein
MNEFSFFSQNTGFIIAVIAVTCILLGRVWSNFVNWGAITDPQLLLRKGENYKVINLYLPKGWTEGWELGSIICLETYDRFFFIKYQREIYVSGDRIRFSNDGPQIGAFYRATFPGTSSGTIIMHQISTRG